MKRIAWVLAFCLLVAFCAASSAATEVKIWHTFTEGQQAALEKYAADFNASQSDYTQHHLQLRLRGGQVRAGR